MGRAVDLPSVPETLEGAKVEVRASEVVAEDGAGPSLAGDDPPRETARAPARDADHAAGDPTEHRLAGGVVVARVPAAAVCAILGRVPVLAGLIRHWVTWCWEDYIPIVIYSS